MNEEVHPVVQGLAGLAGLATAVWSTWCTVVAFVGGTMPIIGWETDGGLGFGMLWLLVLEPLVITVAFFAVQLVLVPIVMVLGLIGRDRSEH